MVSAVNFQRPDVMSSLRLVESLFLLQFEKLNKMVTAARAKNEKRMMIRRIDD
jgi:hypothetical protein